MKKGFSKSPNELWKRLRNYKIGKNKGIPYWVQVMYGDFLHDANWAEHYVYQYRNIYPIPLTEGQLVTSMAGLAEIFKVHRRSIEFWFDKLSVLKILQFDTIFWDDDNNLPVNSQGHTQGHTHLKKIKKEDYSKKAIFGSGSSEEFKGITEATNGTVV